MRALDSISKDNIEILQRHLWTFSSNESTEATQRTNKEDIVLHVYVVVRKALQTKTLHLSNPKIWRWKHYRWLPDPVLEPKSMNTCCLNNIKNQDTEEENRPSLKATQIKKAQRNDIGGKHEETMERSDKTEIFISRMRTIRMTILSLLTFICKLLSMPEQQQFVSNAEN